MDLTDTTSAYRAVRSRDRRFDGVFYTAVTSTRIYCRPSCPAITPHQRNVRFYRTAAAAHEAGFRACKRCLPDATPGSPDWDVAADAAGRAMRLIADGTVERDGVEGLARRVGYTPRHLSRLLVQEVGAGPLALARARRAQTARTLVETSDMPFSDVAFAAGFASIRQFNDTMREVYASTPTALRGRPRQRARSEASEPAALHLRLAVRRPYAAEELLRFLAARLVPGVEAAGPGWYARSLRLPHGAGWVRLRADGAPESGFVRCSLRLEDLRDVAAAVERCRRLLDADCDPVAVDEALGADALLAPLVRRRPGLRVPGHVDGHELAVRAVLGQQVTIGAARTVAGRLTEKYGDPVPDALTEDESPVVLFPAAEVLAALDPQDLPMPRARGRALTSLCAVLEKGVVPLDRSAERSDVRRALLDLPGIGPWTAGYIAMRALGDPDVFLPTDVGVRNALAVLGADPAQAGQLSESWRPWRSYAQLHLWASLSPDQRED